MSKLTSQEVIATFMEPQPRWQRGCGNGSVGGWWRLCGLPGKETWQVPDCTLFSLDRPRQVESRLTNDQWRHYALLMFNWLCHDAKTTNVIEDLLTENRKALLHASNEIKIDALAAVLLPLVEGRDA